MTWIKNVRTIFDNLASLKLWRKYQRDIFFTGDLLEIDYKNCSGPDIKIENNVFINDYGFHLSDNVRNPYDMTIEYALLRDVAGRDTLKDETTVFSHKICDLSNINKGYVYFRLMAYNKIGESLIRQMKHCKNIKGVLWRNDFNDTEISFFYYFNDIINNSIKNDFEEISKLYNKLKISY